MLIALVVVLVLVAALVAYALVQRANPLVLRTSVDIDATPDEVWDVLADRDAWSAWNPFIVSSTGESRVGGVITNVMRDATGRETTFTPRLLAVDPGRELRWLGRIPPGLLFDGEHAFTLIGIAPGRTRLGHTEHFRGVLVPLLARMLRRDTLPQFEAMNRALADRVAAVRHG